jgi:hypothetical protein
MRRQRNPAIVNVIVGGITGDQIVMGGAGVVAEQDAAGVVLDQIPRDDRMIDAAEVDALAAIFPFLGLERRQSRAGGFCWLSLREVLGFPLRTLLDHGDRLPLFRDRRNSSPACGRAQLRNGQRGRLGFQAPFTES